MPSRAERRALALSWSGGKDSALALWALREEVGAEPLALLTTFTEDYDRVSMHGVRRELLRAQAEAAGVELVEVEIPAGCSNEAYGERMAAALARPPLDRAATIAFADLFLADVRAYREERLAAAGRRGRFPLWGRDTAALAREFIAAGFEAILVCVDPAQLDPSFVGRPYDHALLADLPSSVDPCGENGEFHTFVHAGPIFDAPVEVELGDTVRRDGFAFQDLLPKVNSRQLGPQAQRLRRRRRRLLDAAEKHGVDRLRVFGSLARGDASATSDIDLLVDLKPGRTLLNLAAFRREAAEILDLPVDVATADMLKERIREEALNEAVPL